MATTSTANTQAFLAYYEGSSSLECYWHYNRHIIISTDDVSMSSAFLLIEENGSVRSFNEEPTEVPAGFLLLGPADEKQEIDEDYYDPDKLIRQVRPVLSDQTNW